MNGILMMYQYAGGGDLVVNNVFVAGYEDIFTYNFPAKGDPELTVAPGDTGLMELIFTPTEAGSFGGGLVLHTNDPEGWPIIEVNGDAIPAGYVFESFEGEQFPPLGWATDAWTQSTFGGPLSGTEFAYCNLAGSALVTPGIMVETGDYISFGFRNESAYTPQSMDVYVGDELVWQVVDNATNEYQIVNIPLDDYAGETVNVTFVGQSGTGGWSYGICVDDVLMPPVEIVGPRVAFTPEELFFGNVLANEESVEREFLVTNVGGLDLDLTSAISSSDEFVVSDFGKGILAPGESDTMTVVFSPLSAMGYEEYIEVISDSETNPDTLWMYGGGYDPISYYEEDFNINFSCSVVDANEDGITWGWLTFDGFDAFAGIGYATAGNDDYLITPKLHINAGDLLQFESFVYNAGFPESFEVYVETGNDVSTWTTAVMDSTIDNVVPMGFEVDLAAYAGTDVYIGFRNISVDMYYQFIDNIKVGPEITPIHDIQFVVDPETDDATPLDGQVVNVRGVISTAAGEFSNSYFFIQDAEMPWSGIQVYASGNDTLNRGDEVIVSGTAGEYSGKTQIGDVTAIVVLGSGNEVLPIEIPIADLGSAATGEAYEAVLVGVKKVEVTEVNGTNVKVTDGVDTASVSTYYTDFVDVSLEVGDVIDLAGLVWPYNGYPINPRNDADVYKYSVGGVEGTVTDVTAKGDYVTAKGDSLAGVTVSLNEELSTVTDEDGYYLIGGVLEGEYTLKTEFPGYMPHVENIAIAAETLEVNIEIEEYNFEMEAPTGLMATAHDKSVALDWAPPGAGGDIEEGFEGITEIPDGWGNIDNDGDGSAWFIYDVEATSHTGLNSAGCLYNSAGNDDWLITPVLMDPGEAASFSFWAAPQDPDYSVESFNVYVSTAGPDIANFGTPVLSYTFDAGDIVWQEFIVDLSTYSEESQLWVAIQCVSVDQFILKIDDVMTDDFGGDTKIELTTGLRTNDLAHTIVKGKTRATAEILVTDGSRYTKGDKEIEYATWWVNEKYLPGSVMTIDFGVTNASSDVEWILFATLDFPEGVEVIDATPLNALPWDGSTGDGAFVTWGGSGYMGSSETAITSITLAFDPSLTENLEIPWTLTGDEWGDPPHDVSGVLELTTFQPGDFLGYNVFMVGDKSEPVNPFPIQGLHYDVFGLEDETEYCFEATSVYFPGVDSDPSNQACATTIYEFGDVAGTVLNPNGDPVVNATVTSGYAVCITDVDGNYLLEDLFPGMNTVKVNSDAFDDMAQDVEIIAQADPVVLDFSLIPSLDKPGGLVAVVGDAVVDLNWKTPGGLEEVELMYDDGSFESSITGGATDIEVSTKFTPGSAGELYTGRFLFSSAGQTGYALDPVELRIYTVGGDGLPGELVYVSEELLEVPAEDVWVDVDLSGFAFGEEGFFLGYRYTTTEGPGTGRDTDNHVYGHPYVFVSGSWTESSDLGFPGNFGIRAIVGLEGVKAEVLSSATIPENYFTGTTTLLSSSSTPDFELGVAQDIPSFHVENEMAKAREDSLVGYNVYRMEMDVEDLLLATVEDTFYTDLSVANYTEYGYYVKALWDTDEYDTLESKPSNVAMATPWMLGDVNFDNDVNVQDIIKVVNNILLLVEFDDAEMQAADLNNDLEINIFDVISLINMTMNGALAKDVNDPGLSASLVLPEIAPVNKEGGSLDLGLDFEGAAYGLQFTVKYNPNVMKLGNPAIRGNGLTVASNVEKGEMVVVAYSTTGKKINFSQDMISIPVEMVNEKFRGNANINIDNFLLAGPQGPIVLDKSSGQIEVTLVPMEFALYQNYPNPFNPTTTINYDLPKTTYVDVAIYNMLGQKIRTLVSTQKKFGYHNSVWNGLTDDGVSVSSGVYIYRIMAGDFIKTKKMVLMK